MVALIAVTLYPLLFVLFASLSDPALLSQHRGLLMAPLDLTFEAYHRVFQNPMILTGYRNTLFYVVAGTALNLVMTTLGAYALSRRELRLKNPIMFFIVFTMFFSGGLIPPLLPALPTPPIPGTPPPPLLPPPRPTRAPPLSPT